MKIANTAQKINKVTYKTNVVSKLTGKAQLVEASASKLIKK